tara:strand:+ start:293 stop:895 length:603 start_codon:yes stop_codon:yes gene_type:complete
MLSFLFYLFASTMLISCVFVIITPNPVFSVFYLILGFCNASAILLLFELEFLGLLLLIIYVGAIAVLFLFVVMMLNVPVNRVYFSSVHFFFFFFFFFLSFFLFSTFSFEIASFEHSFYLVWFYSFDSVQNVLLMANVLYSFYFVPFLIAGFILLVAIVGAILLTLNRNLVLKNNTFAKKQLVYQQLSRDSKKAIFLFSQN